MTLSTRTITVNDRVWKYKIGKSNVVARAVDNNDKKVINLSSLLGKDWNIVSRERHKRQLHITPKHISDWLIRNG